MTFNTIVTYYPHRYQWGYHASIGIVSYIEAHSYGATCVSHIRTINTICAYYTYTTCTMHIRMVCTIYAPCTYTYTMCILHIDTLCTPHVQYIRHTVWIAYEYKAFVLQFIEYPFIHYDEWGYMVRIRTITIIAQCGLLIGYDICFTISSSWHTPGIRTIIGNAQSGLLIGYDTIVTAQQPLTD